MSRFDFTLSRPKDYYVEKMKGLEAEYEQRGKYIGKRYLKGIHFRPQGEKIFGYFCPERGYHKRGLVLPFFGRFTEGNDGSLHFRGFVYLRTEIMAFLIVFLLLAVFLVKRDEIILIGSVALVSNLVSLFIHSPTAIKALEEFFV